MTKRKAIACSGAANYVKRTTPKRKPKVKQPPKVLFGLWNKITGVFYPPGITSAPLTAAEKRLGWRRIKYTRTDTQALSF